MSGLPLSKHLKWKGYDTHCSDVKPCGLTLPSQLPPPNCRVISLRQWESEMKGKTVRVWNGGQESRACEHSSNFLVLLENTTGSVSKHCGCDAFFSSLSFCCLQLKHLMFPYREFLIFVICKSSKHWQFCPVTSWKRLKFSWKPPGQIHPLHKWWLKLIIKVSTYRNTAYVCSAFSRSEKWIE